MAKTVLREIPTEVPHASIYLDDLFEIEQIIRDAYAALPAPREITFEYEVDRAFTLTEHQELIDHSGQSSQFCLNIVDSRSSSKWRALRIRADDRPIFKQPPVLGDAQWAMFTKVEQIFASRKSTMRNILEPIPWPLMMLLLLICSSAFYVIAAYSPSRSAVRYQVFNASIVTVGIVFYFCKTSKNRIYFKHARQEEKRKEDSRKEIIVRVLLALVSAIVGIVGTLLTSRYKR